MIVQLPIRRLVLGIFVLTAVIVIGGLGLAMLGHGRWGFADTLYMAVISVSTVGFSELPGIEHVAGARAFTVVIILGGIGSVAYFQSSLTALLVEGTIGHVWRRNRMRKVIDALSGHVVVAGLGSTGRYVVEELHATGTPFIAIERNREHIERMSHEITGGTMLFIHGDATEDHTLAEAGVARASGVIAALTSDKDNLYVTLSARAMNAKARIISKVVEAEAMPKMKRAGADATVSPNMIGGRRMASELIRPEVVEFLDQMLRDKERNLRLEEITVPDASSYVGHPLRDVNLRREANVLVVAVRDHDRKFRYNPGPDHVLEAGTVLVVLGETVDVIRLREMMARGFAADSVPKMPVA